MWLYNALLILAFLPANTKKGTLVVEVTGIKNPTGQLQLGLYNKNEGFSEKDKVYIGRVAEVTSTSVKIEFTDLPHGTYAISAYHDKNKNGKLDKSLLGMPTEIYGFSNNARGVFGPPNFDDAKFTFGTNKSKVSFELK